MVNEEGGVRASAIKDLGVKLQAQNAMVTAIAALLLGVAGAAVNHHTHLLVDLADRLETAGLAINNLVSVVGSMSSSIGDVRILTEDGTYLTLVKAVLAAPDALSTTNEVAELDSRLVLAGIQIWRGFRTPVEMEEWGIPLSPP